MPGSGVTDGFRGDGTTVVRTQPGGRRMGGGTRMAVRALALTATLAMTALAVASPQSRTARKPVERPKGRET